MAAPTGTLQTYQAKGNREDLSDLISMISPTDTPFYSAIKKGKAGGTKVEWQTDALDNAANNAQVEGDDTTFAALTPTTRWDNYAQISRKSWIVSGTQEAMNSAGRKSELGHQRMKAAEALKRDIEVALTVNSTYNAGNGTTARQTRGLEGWLTTGAGTTGNGQIGTTGVAPVASTNTAATDGTQRALTEAMLKTAIATAYTNGGNPDMIMCGVTQKQAISAFTGNVTRMQDIGSKEATLYTSFSFYSSDFGVLKVVPNRFQRARTLFVLQKDGFELAVLRPFTREALAKTGDGTKEQLIIEYALKVDNEAQHATVRDLS